MRVNVGVLALQGDFAAHVRALAKEGIRAEEVRYPAQLAELGGLILPGGESTTLLRLAADRGFEDPLRRFHERGGTILGTCAGAILVAGRVLNPEQRSFAFIDIDVERNAYGRQKESFETREPAPFFGGAPLEMVFIRAPRIRRTGPGVEILAARGGEPVLVRQGSVLASTFHPELTEDRRLHRLFATMASGAAMTAS